MIARETVERWLEEAGVPRDDVSVDDPDQFAWVLGFRGGAYTTIVAHPPVEWNHLEYQVAISISPRHQELLEKLDDDTRERFMFDLRLQLLGTPIGFSLELDESEILQRMVFGINVFDENLEKAGFFRRNHQLQNAGLMAVTMVQKLAHFESWKD